MNKQAEEEALNICKENKKLEIDRYYQTVLLTLGFKDFLDRYAKECEFVSAEPRFSIDNREKEIKPDIVLQYGNKNGVLCEIKTSFPFDEKQLLKSLKQLENYSQEAYGWETADRKVDEHDILLFCSIIDYDRVSPKIEDWMEKGELEITKNLCICEWGMFLYPKWGREIILIRKRSGKTSCTELDTFLHKNIRIDVNALHTKYEKCKFTRKEPPIEYTMTQLWMDVFPSMDSKKEELETSVEEVLEIAYRFYIPWSNIKGEFSQIRHTWVKKVMEKYCEIGLAEKHPKTKGKYKILRDKKFKNIQDHIIEKLCKETTREKTKSLLSEMEEDTGQKKIDSFG